jgi:hypothetical protein
MLLCSSLVARSDDSLQQPHLVFENMARVKRLMKPVNYTGPLSFGGDCTKVRQRLAYSNDFGSHVLGSVLPEADHHVFIYWWQFAIEEVSLPAPVYGLGQCEHSGTASMRHRWRHCRDICRTKKPWGYVNNQIFHMGIFDWSRTLFEPEITQQRLNLL